MTSKVYRLFGGLSYFVLPQKIERAFFSPLFHQIVAKTYNSF